MVSKLMLHKRSDHLVLAFLHEDAYKSTWRMEEAISLQECQDY